MYFTWKVISSFIGLSFEKTPHKMRCLRKEQKKTISECVLDRIRSRADKTGWRVMNDHTDERTNRRTTMPTPDRALL